MPMAGPVCPGCRKTAILAPNTDIYGPNPKRAGNVWRCPDYPDCDHYISARSDGDIPYPTGTMAGPRLRALRSQLYNYLKPLYTDHRSKIRVYRDLAVKMGWHQSPLNISALDEAKCLKALKLVNPDFVERSPSTEIPRSWQDID